MRRRHVLAFFGAILATGVFSLGLKSVSTAPAIAQSQTTILVSAAASLQDAMRAIEPTFERAHPEIAVNYNFGSSGALQRQISQGAPADVFFSAAIPQMDALEQQGRLMPRTRRNLLQNRLVLIVPQNSTLNLTGFRQLSDRGVRKISVGEFRSVPAGQYAEQVLSNLGMLESLRSKLVFANTVRAVLAAVATGNADAGIVYATDARISSQVKQVATAPENLHAPITYPIAIVADTKNPEAARTFVQFLSSDRARSIFEQFGFSLAA